MKKLVFTIVLLVLAGGAWADETPAKTATVGGGAANPWRSPYKTAVVIEHAGMTAH